MCLRHYYNGTHLAPRGGVQRPLNYIQNLPGATLLEADHPRSKGDDPQNGRFRNLNTNTSSCPTNCGTLKICQCWGPVSPGRSAQETQEAETLASNPPQQQTLRTLLGMGESLDFHVDRTATA